MPAAFAVVELADVLVSLFVALCLVAAYVLLRAIGSVLPDFHVAFVHINLKGMFESAAGGVERWLIRETIDFLDHITAVFHAVAWIFSQIWGDAVKAITHVGDQIAHIVNTEIPEARRAVEHFALSEIATAKRDVLREVRGGSADVRRALSKADRAIYHRISAVESTIRGDIRSAVSAGVDGAESYTDRAIRELRSYVDQAVGGAEAAATRDLGVVRQQLGQAIAGAAATAEQNLQAAEHTLTGEIGQVGQTAATSIANAQSLLTGEIQSSAATAASALTSAERTLGGEITQVGQTAAAGVASAEQAAQAEVGSAVQTLTGEISSTGRTLSGDIASAAQAAAGDLSSVQGLLEAAITTAVAGVAVRVAKLEECSVGVCDDSPNNFSNLLQQAMGAASLAELLAFFGEAIRNPAGAGVAVSGELQAVFGGGEQLFHQLLNL